MKSRQVYLLAALPALAAVLLAGRLIGARDGDAMGASVGYDVDRSPLLNPERGWMVGHRGRDPREGSLRLDDTDRPQDYTGIARAARLAYAGVRLDRFGAAGRDFRARALDDAMLAELQVGFDRVRAAGFKVVLRFSYSSPDQVPGGGGRRCARGDDPPPHRPAGARAGPERRRDRAGRGRVRRRVGRMAQLDQLPDGRSGRRAGGRRALPCPPARRGAATRCSCGYPIPRARLASRPVYSVRLANAGLWREQGRAAGMNELTTPERPLIVGAARGPATPATGDVIPLVPLARRHAVVPA